MEKTKAPKVDVKAVIGRQVKRLRQESGATQDELAERCGIYRTYLSRIEGGMANPTVTVLAALAIALGVEIQDLFRETHL